MCKRCKTHERIIRKADDQLLFCCGECLEDKMVEIVADAQGGNINIRRDLGEYIEDTYGSDSD